MLHLSRWVIYDLARSTTLISAMVRHAGLRLYAVFGNVLFRHNSTFSTSHCDGLGRRLDVDLRHTNAASDKLEFVCFGSVPWRVPCEPRHANRFRDPDARAETPSPPSNQRLKSGLLLLNHEN